MPEVVFATYNLHCGVDGWGRPFDVVSACLQLEADVLVLQETFSPEGGESAARQLAHKAGYQILEVPMASGWLRSWPVGEPHSPRWRPLSPRQRGGFVSLRTHAKRYNPKGAHPRLSVPGTPGSLGLALLAKGEMVRQERCPLPQLGSDGNQRWILSAELRLGGTTWSVVGTHLAHLEQGSWRQMRALGAYLSGMRNPLVVMGDMNSWAFPLRAFLRDLRPAVVGKTYPSWRPHSQIDHILLRGEGLAVLDADIPAIASSDHRPARARLSFKG